MSSSPQRPARWIPLTFSLVGVLMFVGFGAALRSRIVDTLHAPAAPTRVEAERVPSTVRGGASWIVIDGVLEPCRLPDVRSDTTAVYRVLFATSGQPIGLLDVYGARACSDVPERLSGTTHTRTLDDLDLESDAARFLAENLGPEIVVLYVDDSPRLGLGEASMWAAMALLGLFIAWFYAAATLARSAKVRMPALPTRPALPILPARPLSLARAYRSSPVIAIGFFAICAVMFAGITMTQWPSGGAAALDGETIALLVFGAAMTLVFVFLLLVMLRSALRARPTIQSPREAWAEVIAHEAALARRVDVGNRVVSFRDPFANDGEPERIVELSIGANEGMAWIVDGHVLVARAEGDRALYVLRDDGGPFELSDQELPRSG
jgi:hypothetical protein